MRSNLETGEILDFSPSDTIKFDISVAKIILTLLGCACFIAMGIWQIIYGSDLTKDEIFIAYLAVLFFIILVIVGLFRFSFPPSPTLELSPAGLLDQRLFRNTLPWSAINRIDVAAFRGGYSIKGIDFIIVSVDEEWFQKLDLTWFARWSRGPNKLLNVHGLAISSSELQVDHKTLLRMMEAYWTAWNSPSPKAYSVQ